MKCCIISPKLTRRGAEGNAFYTALNTSKMNNEVTVICKGVEDVAVKELTNLKIIKVDGFEVKLPVIESLIFSYRARKAFERINEKFEIVQCYGHSGLFLTRGDLGNAKLFSRCQGVVSALKENYPINDVKSAIAKYVIFPVISFLDDIAFRKSDYVIAISKSIKRELEIYHNVGEEKIKILCNGVNPDEFKINNKKANKVVRLLYVGRLVPQKGVDVLLNSLYLAKKNGFNFELIIAGSGILEDNLKKLLHSLGLDESVKFSGFITRTELPKYYTQSDIFILPSRYEPFGMVLVEAMASGLPVIASDVGGMTEIVINGKTGLLVPPDDTKALTDAIMTLIGDKKKRASMGAAGRRRVENYFNWRSIAKQTLNIWRGVQ